MIVPKPPKPAAPLPNDVQPSRSRIPWARLLKQVFGIDVETCHLCEGKMKIVAAIEDPVVIKKILKAPRLTHSAAIDMASTGAPYSEL